MGSQRLMTSLFIKLESGLGNLSYGNLVFFRSIGISYGFFCSRKLLTRDRKCYIDDKVCVLCNTDVESAEHLFFEYPVSKIIWNVVRKWLGMEKLMTKASTMLRAFRGIYRGNSYLAKTRCNVVATCVYFIWTARNRAIFEDEKPSVQDIVHKIKISVFRCLPPAGVLPLPNSIPAEEAP